MPENALLPQTVDVVIAVWLFVLGAVVGSFLNVVVYRVPLGKSLVRPPSHCPNCKHPIRWFDNLPIFGWIALGGRCRDCGEKFSVRYPLVEFSTAVLFLMLGVVECVFGGLNLPGRETLGMWQPFGIYAYHILLMCTLLSAALIQYDGRRVPSKLFVPTIAVGVVAGIVWPWLRPVHAFDGLGTIEAGIVDALAGLLVALPSGWVILKLLGKKAAGGLMPTLACVGLFLGWQAALALALVTLLLSLPVRAAGWKVPGTLAIMTLATACWLMGWASLAGLVE